MTHSNNIVVENDVYMVVVGQSKIDADETRAAYHLVNKTTGVVEMEALVLPAILQGMLSYTEGFKEQMKRIEGVPQLELPQLVPPKRVK